MNEEKNLAGILESVLFVHGAPISVARLAKLTDAAEDETREALRRLAEDLKNRGLLLMEKDSMVQMGTRPEHARYVEDLIKGEFSEEMSPAARETMAVIAYRGPVSRAEIDYIRGVNSSFTLRMLLMRGLVERAQNTAGDARGPQYRASMDFLKHMGIARREDLPRWEEFSRAEIPKMGQE